MGLNNHIGNGILSHFLQAYPVSTLRSMTIEQYADLNDHNAFCYWLEYGSKYLGEIGGMPLTKFGLWKYKNRKDYDEMYESDTVYAWNAKFGKHRTEAFYNIKNSVADIAEAAHQGDWNRIQNIDFHSVAKWKIAFLYSNNRLLPIYTREGLLAIASGLKGRFPENTPVIELQQFIISKKPVEVDMLDYARELWDHYVKGKPFRNYFIVGSKYKDEHGADTKDVFPEMLASNSIAIGFLSSYDLSTLFGATEDQINQFVAEHSSEETIIVSRLQSYFRILLQLKPGDIIAVKSHGSHGMLKIIAYAVVTEKNGKVYEYKPEHLGHHINVEFVELGINRNLSLNYAGTIHRINPDKHDHLMQIFGPFLQVDNIALGSEVDDNPSGEDDKLKGEDTYQRGPVAARMVRQLHNIIQNSFYKELRKKYPNDKITLEYEGRVDIVRESAKERCFYEIKPFENVVACLREATGQLLEYTFRFPSTKKTTLIIVGPGELKGEAMGYFDHYVDSINLPLQYEQHVAQVRQDKKQPA